MNLITFLISEDEGSHRYVINVLSDPVHLGHHPVHFADILTCSGKYYLYNSCLSVYQYETCNNDNCAGTGNTHPLDSRNKMDFILWVFFSQFHHNLVMSIIIKSVCSHVMRYNLRPRKGLLIAKVEDEAVVYDVLTLDPRHRYTYKLQFFLVCQNSCRMIVFYPATHESLKDLECRLD